MALGYGFTRSLPKAAAVWSEPLSASALILATGAVLTAFAASEAVKLVWLLGAMVAGCTVFCALAATMRWDRVVDLSAALWVYALLMMLFHGELQADLEQNWWLTAGAFVLCAVLHVCAWWRLRTPHVVAYAAAMSAVAYYYLLSACLGDATQWRLFWFLPFNGVAAALALWFDRRGLEGESNWMYAVPAIIALVSVAVPIGHAHHTVASTTLLCYTLISVALAFAIPRPPIVRAATTLGSLTFLYTLGHMLEPHPEHGYYSMYALYTVLFAAALMGTGAIIEYSEGAKRELVQPLYTGSLGLAYLAALTGFIECAQMPTVATLLLVGALNATAKYLFRNETFQHLAFASCLVAVYLILGDAHRKGLEELSPYRSADLYFAPIGLYLVFLGLRRRTSDNSDSAASLCTLGLLIALGSAFLSSLIAENSVLHDFGFIGGTVAAGFFGLSQRIRSFFVAGCGLFAHYVLISLGRNLQVQENWMILGLLAGVAVIVSGIWFERRKAEVTAKWDRTWEEFRGWEP